MNQLVPLASSQALPAIVTAPGEGARIRFLEFFDASIRNAHTRRAYAGAVAEFLASCESKGVASIAAVQPLHVAAYIEALSKARSAPTAKQRLAAIRRLFDWLVLGQVMPHNPAASVRQRTPREPDDQAPGDRPLLPHVGRGGRQASRLIAALPA